MKLHDAISNKAITFILTSQNLKSNKQDAMDKREVHMQTCRTRVLRGT